MAIDIRTARLAAGLTQKQLGEACGYKGDPAQVYVAMWENGTRPIPRNKLRAVAKALNVPVDELLP